MMGSCRFAAASFALLLCFSAARADVIQVFDPSDIRADGALDWGALGAPLIPVAQPFTREVPGVAGLNVTVSQQLRRPFLRFDQRLPMGPGWNGDFAPGDKLLYTNRVGGPVAMEDTSVTFEFDAPIQGFGIQAEPAGGGGPYTALIRVFDSSGDLLGSFSAGGTGDHAADNSAAFLGVLSDAADIFRVVIDVRVNNDVALDGFAFNAPRIQIAQAAPPPPATPEPASIVLFSLVGCAAVVYLRWQHRRAGRTRVRCGG